MKNRKLGFTLVELIAVIVLLALVMMLVVPSLNRLLNENNDKRYKTYEDMMLEYTKAYPNYTSKSKICLNDLAMKEMGSNIICNGYVDVSNMKAYLSCVQNGKQIYVTSGYNLPSTCVTNSGSIPGGEAATFTINDSVTGTSYNNNGLCYVGTTIRVTLTCHSTSEITSFTSNLSGSVDYSADKKTATITGNIAASSRRYHMTSTCSDIYGNGKVLNKNYTQCQLSEHPSCNLNHYDYVGTCRCVTDTGTRNVACSRTVTNCSRACSGSSYSGSCSRRPVYNSCYHA